MAKKAKTAKKVVKKAAKKVAAKKQVKKSSGSKMSSVVHFEMPYTDAKRVAKFYSQAFGWNMNILGSEMGAYVLAGTSEADKKGHPKEKGRINGGFFPKSPNAETPNLVLATDNLKNAVRRLEKAGGKALGEPMNIPGYGTYISFTDTEGNRVALMQPSNEWM
ncbi:MAG: VOC family protein [Bacteroidia bacterium]